MTHNFKKLMLLLCLSGLTSIAGRTAAFANEERDGVYTLGEVVVSGRSEGVEATGTVQRISAEEIRERGARTLDQAIALLPGVNVRTGGEGVPRIDIRGFRTRHVILLLDGVPLNSAFDQQFDPTIIPTENIAEIKLTSGGSSLLYGQGGLGGVINIITKKGRAGVQGTLGLETGDHAPYLVKGSLSGARDKADYFFSASAAQVDATPLSASFHPTTEQGGGYRRNSDRERRNLFGNFGFTPFRDLALGLTITYSEGNFGKPGSIINDPLDPFAAPPKYQRVASFSDYSMQLAADYSANERLSIRSWVFTNRHDQHDNQYDNAAFNSFNLTTGSLQAQIRTSISGVSLQPRYDLGKAGAVTLSLAAEQDNWQSSGVVTSALNSFGPLNADKTLGNYSSAFEYEFSPLKDMGIVAGYGHYWQSRQERSEDDYSLLAGIYYDLFADTRVKGAFKRNIRLPSLGDLYDLSQGNPNLAAEHSAGFEAGVEQKLPGRSELNLTGFYTVARNLIQNDQVTGTNKNLAEIRFTGFELAAATRFIDGLFLRGSYAWLDSADKSRTGREQQQYTPGNKVTLEGKYDFSSGLTPYVSLLYVGQQYFYTKNNVTPVQKALLNDYTLVNVKLSQRLLQNSMTLYLGADNLFDGNYETSYGLPRAGRFVYGGVEFRL